MSSAASAQRQGQVVAKQFKSFAKAMSEFSKNPKKFRGKPQLTGYKNRYRTFCVGRNGYRITNGLLTITGAEEIGFCPVPVRCCRNQVFNAKADEAVAGDLRIVAMGNSFIIELTYIVKQEDINNKIMLNPSQH